MPATTVNGVYTVIYPGATDRSFVMFIFLRFRYSVKRITSITTRRVHGGGDELELGLI